MCLLFLNVCRAGSSDREANADAKLRQMYRPPFILRYHILGPLPVNVGKKDEWGVEIEVKRENLMGGKKDESESPKQKGGGVGRDLPPFPQEEDASGLKRDDFFSREGHSPPAGSEEGSTTTAKITERGADIRPFISSPALTYSSRSPPAPPDAICGGSDSF